LPAYGFWQLAAVIFFFWFLPLADSPATLSGFNSGPALKTIEALHPRQDDPVGPLSRTSIAT
jgi:hypothetical protein